MAQISATKRRRISPTLASQGRDTSPSTLEADDNLARASRWDSEQDYEQRPRKLRKQEGEITRLPIKTPEGRIEQLVVPLVTKIEGAESNSGFSEEEDGGEAEEEQNEQETMPEVSSRQQIIEAKVELARIAGLLNEDPEENMPLFRSLSQLASSRNFTVKKLALATQLTVYKDVIPGYRIRPLLGNDMTAKVSKEVRRLRSFEQSLVAGYQNYIRELARLAKEGRGDSIGKDAASLSSVSISCACGLLVAVPHFNFRGDVLKILVDKLGGKKVDDDFVKCRETLETVFRNDEDGAASLDAVALLTKMMKARHYHIDESVLNTFLHLRLLSEFSSKGSRDSVDRPEDDPSNNIRGKKRLKEKKQFRTKAQRKLEKERKAVEKEFKEADATVSHEERDRRQAETLKLVFVTYFRILKARTPRLMGAVLEGLAKYAHLINQDFFGDLLEALKDLIGHAASTDPTEEDLDDRADETDEATQRNAIRESLLCITTAFALLHGQDNSTTGLNLDLSFFTTHLYRTLYPLSLNPDLELSAKSLHLQDPNQPSQPPKNNKINIATTTILLLRTLSYILLPPRDTRAVPPVRVAAFTKQLMTTSLQLPEKSCVAMLALLTKVAKSHGRKMAGLWNTEERRGDGVFDPLRAEVEGSNPYASTVWEGEILRKHFCPEVREEVKALEGMIGRIN